MKPYQFVLVRYLHSITGGETVNIGVVAFEPDGPRLRARFTDRYGRVSRFFGGIDGLAFRNLVRHVERQFLRIEEDLNQPQLIEETPRTLPAVLQRVLPDDDSSFVASVVMSGVVDDVEQRLGELYWEFVERFEAVEERHKREESDITRALDERLSTRGLVNEITFNYPLSGPNYSHAFHAAWMNGKRQVLDPISFDLVEGRTIIEKASQWSGRLFNLSKGSDFGFTALVAPPSEPTLGNAFDRAVAILRGSPNVRLVAIEGDMDRVLGSIQGDVESTRAQSAYAD